MSQWLSEILSRQIESHEDSAQMESCLLMETANYHCAVSFEYLSEVIEMQNIVPYPQEHECHLGIVNLRGEVIPVLSLESLVGIEVKKDLSLPKDARLVIFSSSKGPFAIPVHSIKKSALPVGSLRSTNETEIDGRIYGILNDRFLKTVERISA